MVAGGFDNPGGDFVETEIVGFDPKVCGVAVEGSADFQKLPDGALGVVVVQERAIGVSRGAFEDLGRAGDEPDDVSEFAKKAAVFLPSDNPSSGGDDVARVLVEGAEQVGFEIAKGLLSICFENFGNGPALLLDDQVVGIDERVAKGLGKVSPDSGLTRSHESNEDDVPLHALGKKSTFLNSFHEAVSAKDPPWTRN